LPKKKRQATGANQALRNEMYIPPDTSKMPKNKQEYLRCLHHEYSKAFQQGIAVATEEHKDKLEYQRKNTRVRGAKAIVTILETQGSTVHIEDVLSQLGQVAQALEKLVG
jgi:hypothetical protein